MSEFVRGCRVLYRNPNPSGLVQPRWLGDRGGIEGRAQEPPHPRATPQFTSHPPMNRPPNPSESAFFVHQRYEDTAHVIFQQNAKKKKDFPPSSSLSSKGQLPPHLVPLSSSHQHQHQLDHHQQVPKSYLPPPHSVSKSPLPPKLPSGHQQQQPQHQQPIHPHHTNSVKTSSEPVASFPTSNNTTTTGTIDQAVSQATSLTTPVTLSSGSKAVGTTVVTESSEVNGYGQGSVVSVLLPSAVTYQTADDGLISPSEQGTSARKSTSISPTSPAFPKDATTCVPISVHPTEAKPNSERGSDNAFPRPVESQGITSLPPPASPSFPPSISSSLDPQPQSPRQQQEQQHPSSVDRSQEENISDLTADSRGVGSKSEGGKGEEALPEVFGQGDGGTEKQGSTLAAVSPVLAPAGDEWVSERAVEDTAIAAGGIHFAHYGSTGVVARRQMSITKADSGRTESRICAVM